MKRIKKVGIQLNFPSADGDTVKQVKQMYDWLQSEQQPKPITDKEFPSLPECFKNEKEFWELLKIPQIEDLYTISGDGSYHLKDRKKAYLGALAQRLHETDKLKEYIKTSQDLAKIFCPFFNVQFDPKIEKSFQLNRTELIDFDFIK